MIGIVEVRSLRRSPAKHIDLLPQDQVCCLQLCSRPEERSQDAKNQLEQIRHQAASLPRPFPASTPNRIFGTHRGLEGIVSKHALAPYRSGRSKTWLKSKCFTESELVIIGTDRDHKTGAMRALLAKADGHALTYAGVVLRHAVVTALE